MKREINEIKEAFKLKKVLEFDEHECECLALAFGGAQYYRKNKIPTNQVNFF
jgi:hypothetical protein